MSEEKSGKEVRATMHNKRVGGAAGKHIDRDFNLDKSDDHLDPTLTPDNIYWTPDFDKYSGQDKIDRKIPGIWKQEVVYYTKKFHDYIAARSEKSVKQRHGEISGYDVWHSKKTGPEQVIVQFGRKRDDGKADAEVLWEILKEYKAWQDKKFGDHVAIIGMAVHVDEPFCANHIHFDRAYIGTDKDGMTVPSQSDALRNLGIEPPHPEKEIGRKNNAKMTFTKQCREKLVELAKEKGLEIIEEPQKASKSGREFEEYKRDLAREELEEANKTIAEKNKEIAKLEKEKSDNEDKAFDAIQKLAVALSNKEAAEQAAKEAQEEKDRAEKESADKQKEIDGLNQQIADLTNQKAEEEAKRKEAEEKTEKAKKEAEEAKEKLKVIHARQKTAGEELQKTLDMKAQASIIEKPGLFSKDKMVKFHEKCLDYVENIGRAASDDRSRASRYLEKAEAELVSAKQIRDSVKPMQDELQRKLDEIQAMRDDLDKYIAEKAAERFNNWLEKEGEIESNGRGARMEKFLAAIKYQDGQTALDRFNKKEQARAEQRRMSWEKSRY